MTPNPTPDLLPCPDPHFDKTFCVECGKLSEECVGHPEVMCDDCRGRNVTWFAPNELWNKICRPDGEVRADPMLCPRCFALRAMSKGVDVIWRFEPDENTRAQPKGEHCTVHVAYDPTCPQCQFGVQPKGDGNYEDQFELYFLSKYPKASVGTLGYELRKEGWLVACNQLHTQLTESRAEVENLKFEVQRLKAANLEWTLGVQQSNTDIVDMHRDEFKRIVALTDNPEIVGLCERAIAVIEQTCPVIVQRDNAEKERDQLRTQVEEFQTEINELTKVADDRQFVVESLRDHLKLAVKALTKIGEVSLSFKPLVDQTLKTISGEK